MKKEKTYSRTRTMEKLKKKISSILVMAFMISNLVTYMTPITAYAAKVITSYKNAGTGAGTSWNNPENITAVSFPYATRNIANGETSDYLKGTNYNFSSIPLGARIDEVSVSINRDASNSGSVKDSGVHLINNQGTIVGLNKANSDYWTISMASISYTWNADELSASNLTLADIKSSNFGVALSVTSTEGSRTAYVDFMKMYVTYTTDTIAPTISTVTGNAASWQNSDVTLTVNATDGAGESGIAAGGYSFDNGSTWQNSNEKAFSSNQTVNIKVKDVAGNVSDTTTIVIDKIDKARPTVSEVTGNSVSWQNSDVTLTVNATDGAGESGIAATGGYSFDNGVTWQDSNQKVFDTNQIVNIKVKDAAGNISDATTVEITKIDKIAPTTPTLSADITTPTNQNVTVTIAYSEDSATKEYRVAGGEWTVYTEPITVRINAIIDARGIDEVWNESPIGSINITNIDTTAPTLAISQNPTGATDGCVTITPNASDANGIDETLYKFASDDQNSEYFANEGTPFTTSFDVTTNGTYTVYVKDKAGNESEAKITVSNINTYTVTFKDYKGDILKTQSGIYSGHEAKAPDVPERIGYTFGGWYTDSALTIPHDIATLITGDLTLYTKWNIITGLTVCATNSNGTVDGLQPGYTYGDKVTLTAVPSANFKFVSWTDSEGRVLGTNAVYSFVITQDTSITANFAANPLFTVTFYNEANQIISTQTVVQGENAVTPPDPKKPYFTFVSWDKAYTNVQSDLKLYPVFKANTVTYRFTVNNMLLLIQRILFMYKSIFW